MKRESIQTVLQVGWPDWAPIHLQFPISRTLYCDVLYIQHSTSLCFHISCLRLTSWPHKPYHHSLASWKAYAHEHLRWHASEETFSVKSSSTGPILLSPMVPSSCLCTDASTGSHQHYWCNPRLCSFEGPKSLCLSSLLLRLQECTPGSLCGTTSHSEFPFPTSEILFVLPPLWSVPRYLLLL